MVVAIIPARGGSKRIPDKNIKNFNGKPLIAYSIRAAQESGVFDRVIVSTDSMGIAEVARRYGAEIPFMRPAGISGDFAGTDAVILHALTWLGQNGPMPTHACCLYATAPMVRAESISEGLTLLRQARATSAFTVATYPSPIFRALRMDERGRLAMLWPQYHDSRSQDLEEVFHDAGQFYWVDVAKYLAEGRLFSSDAIPVRIARHLVQDIDTPEDWERAERMYRGLTPGDVLPS